jgi:hypothetical protein
LRVRDVRVVAMPFQLAHAFKFTQAPQTLLGWCRSIREKKPTRIKLVVDCNFS